MSNYMMLKDALLGEKLAPVFTEVLRERIKQEERRGEQNHPMLGTMLLNGINTEEKWPKKETLKMELNHFRLRNKTEKLGWFDILLEEVLEAFLEDKPEKQREELIQVAAVAVAIIECLDRETA